MNHIVVADAGPLHYLALIDCADLLPHIFERVVIPAGVRDELRHEDAPEKVRMWIGQSKPWVNIQSPAQTLEIRGLHKGETEALQIALQTKAAAVLMDDLDGRAAARQLGIPAIGTLGLLEQLSDMRLVQLPEVFKKLRQTNFFASPELFETALERDRKRRTQ